MNAFKAWMGKRKARANGELKGCIPRTVRVAFFVCILYGPLIVEKN
mgnify:CR=1 FL=1